MITFIQVCYWWSLFLILGCFHCGSGGHGWKEDMEEDMAFIRPKFEFWN